MPTLHIWCLPLRDNRSTSSHQCGNKGWNKDDTFSTLVLLCYMLSSIMHAEMAAIFVSVPGLILTEGLSTDPGQTCWSQGWSSHFLDHPSDCQSQSSSRRTCPPTEQMWSSVLHSSPQKIHWKKDSLVINTTREHRGSVARSCGWVLCTVSHTDLTVK